MEIQEAMKELKKTKKFRSAQLDAIYWGLCEGLDVTVYAKPELSSEQMRQLYAGMIRGLDVSSYASAEFSVKQMQLLNEIQKYGGDIKKYAVPENSPYILKQILVALRASKKAESKKEFIALIDEEGRRIEENADKLVASVIGKNKESKGTINPMNLF